VLHSDPKVSSERFLCLGGGSTSVLLVATVATGDLNNEEMTKPGCDEPKKEEEIEEVVFPSY
jgi:hypothetical protein